jgi:hypothetical protein
MSQWTALLFRPPIEREPGADREVDVPSIFSSKSVFRRCRWMPGLQPIPKLAEPPRALVGVERADQELLVRPRRRLDDATPSRSRGGRPRRSAPW